MLGETVLDISVLDLGLAAILTEDRPRSHIPIPHGPWALVYLLYML